MKFLIIPALAAMALAAPAFASTDGATVTTSVAASSAGLDLSRSADAQRMAGRLDRAAADACGASPFSARDYQDAVRRSACYRDAMDHALAALNAPAVSAALNERTTPTADR